MASPRARNPDLEEQGPESIVLNRRPFVSSEHDPQLQPAKGKQSTGANMDSDLPERLKLLNGFPRTARFLAADPNKTLLIVRRFDEAAIRNLLLMEGRVAALEAVQKELDEDDYKIYKTNETLTRAASSWEHFALLGSFDTGDSDMPEAAFDIWCSRRTANLERENSETPVELRDEKWKDIKQVLHQYHLLQKRIDECDSDLKSLSSKPLTNPVKRSQLLAERRALINERRYRLGYDEKEVLQVKRRWEVSKALESALKAYQEAVLRYRDMLKLEEPAHRSDNVLSQWVRGAFQTNPGTQQPSRQFLPDTAMDKVYQEGMRPELGPLKHAWSKVFGTHRPKTSDGLTVKPFIQDRVGIGRIASADNLSRLVSRLDFILKWGKDPKFAYPEINYVPESFLHRVVTFFVLIIAAILLIGAIWFLWLVQVKQPFESAQLALLTFFIMAFGFALNFMTTATREQVFGATAAYAAVLVVFIGSNTS